ncbi:MAG: radical SAM protein [Candidatus Bipolaricaulia bacterium]
MNISGLHLLLTYQCNLECDHCFAWGSPWQTGTITLEKIREILRQASELGTVEWFYFEGGEPFLFYPIMVRAVEEAVDLGFKVGIVTNGYWGTDHTDALEWLRPFKGLVQDLSVSSDLLHWSEELSRQAEIAKQAAKELGIPLGIISIAQPETPDAPSAVGKLPSSESGIMYRGRAIEKLVDKAPRTSWTAFTECPFEDLRDPGRLHLDPLGNVHVCQGISLGNVFHEPLGDIVRAFDADVGAGTHPILSPLLAGGPAALIEQHGLDHEDGYADACHLCYEARQALRDRFPQILTPDQMYGVVSA